MKLQELDEQINGLRGVYKRKHFATKQQSFVDVGSTSFTAGKPFFLQNYLKLELGRILGRSKGVEEHRRSEKKTKQKSRKPPPLSYIDSTREGSKTALKRLPGLAM